jgi:hypothetical protein
MAFAVSTLSMRARQTPSAASTSARRGAHWCGFIQRAASAIRSTESASASRPMSASDRALIERARRIERALLVERPRQLCRGLPGVEMLPAERALPEVERPLECGLCLPISALGHPQSPQGKERVTQLVALGAQSPGHPIVGRHQ